MQMVYFVLRTAQTVALIPGWVTGDFPMELQLVAFLTTMAEVMITTTSSIAEVRVLYV